MIARIASAHGRTAAQVVLRWHIQLGNIVIPKSVTPSRIEENFRIFDFELSEEDMRAVFELDREERTGPDPATFG
jgi:diketogulonate reductase-like aldo/keto reductase